MNTATTVLTDEYLDVLPRRVRARICADADGCHVWLGGMSGSTLGGGVARIDGSSKFLHRAVWRLNKGPIPPKEIVIRSCRKRRCVRLDHLRLTTPSTWLQALRHGRTLAS